jgi:hypothetical protein
MAEFIDISMQNDIQNDIQNDMQNDMHKVENNISNDKVYIKGAKNISSKQSLLIIPITKFFTNDWNLSKLINILNGESVISLRLIDWFVTNYCKKYDTIFDKSRYQAIRNGIEPVDSNDFDNMIIVHSNYKGQLKECSKKQFDPFCRRNRVKFYYEPGKYFLTTVGQLNFFKWAIENFIVDYIEENFKSIEDDMNMKLAEKNSIAPNGDVIKITKKRGAPRKCDASSLVSVQPNTSLSTSDNIISNTISDSVSDLITADSNVDLINSGLANIDISELGPNEPLQIISDIMSKQNAGISNIPSELLAKTKNPSKKTGGTRKKKKELVVPYARTMSRHNIPTILNFD